jgi:hypothetical protein
MKLGKKSIKKKRKKESIRLTHDLGSRDMNNPIKSKFNVEGLVTYIMRPI